MNAGTSAKEVRKNWTVIISICWLFRSSPASLQGDIGIPDTAYPFNVTNSEYQSTKAFKCKGSYIREIVEFLDLKGT
ncbi:hypothetical protein CEXT_668081 [Caerostris extrusa]|uniref:Uncharacterized protein n=1 Tax=Caerostris extrusa TaxID=172846 RepID=A0AAV4QDM8_CAEEX|nr:hypothetical protein CEXT_668081 [Caerostris extrusa]